MFFNYNKYYFVNVFIQFFKSKKTKKNKHKYVRPKHLSNSESIQKYGKTNKQLCKIYKGKEIKGTPKNWAYDKCIKKNNWKRCKSLNVYNMWTEFCY